MKNRKVILAILLFLTLFFLFLSTKNIDSSTSKMTYGIDPGLRTVLLIINKL